MRAPLACSLLLATALSPGCIDLKPEPAPIVRWLTIAPRAEDPDVTEPQVPNLPAPAVTSSEMIENRLVRRASDFEVRFDDLVRWAEPPEQSLERALHETLFQRGPFTRDPYAGRRLAVELVAFEVRESPRRVAVVVLDVQAAEKDGTLLIDRRFESAVPVDGEDPALVAKAMSTAMTLVVDQVAKLLAVR